MARLSRLVLATLCLAPLGLLSTGCQPKITGETDTPPPVGRPPPSKAHPPGVSDTDTKRR